MDARTRPGVAPALPIEAAAASLPPTLAGVADAAWSAIERGAVERWTPWGLPMLATAGPDGAPGARVLALRRVERAERRLWFHTDLRSPKVEALRREPRASVLFWSPADAVEVRLAGRVAVHADGHGADAAWRDASPLSQSAARIALAPGTPLRRASSFDALVQEGDEAVARSHFCALAFVADTLDWLWLGPRDLRRAQFAWIGRDWVGQWTVP